MNKLLGISFLFLPLVAFADESSLLKDAPSQHAPVQFTQQISEINTTEFTQNLQQVGISYEIAEANLNITANQQTLLSSIPSLQALGALNLGMQNASISSHPISYAGAASLHFASLILPFVYKNNSAQNTHVNMYLDSPDDFGHLQKHLIMSFDFNRELFDKVDWNNFPPENLTKIAPNFKLDSWYEGKVGKG